MTQISEMTRLSESSGVSIIFPAYSEEQRLPRTLGELDRYQSQFDGDFEVIVADDGSSDGTAALVNREALTTPWPRLLRRPRSGKGAAVCDVAPLPRWGIHEPTTKL